MTAPPLAIKPMREEPWSDQVKRVAETFGWRMAHFRPARTSKGYRTAMEGHTGFPDWVFVKDGRLIFAELKTDRRGSKTSADQEAWLVDLHAAGAETYVWRPSDFDEVARVLGRRAR